VWQRGCTVVALLPNLSHTDWYRKFVWRADEYYLLSDKVRFGNPFSGRKLEDYFYPCLLVVWRAAPAEPPVPRPPVQDFLDLPRAAADDPERVDL